MSNAAAPEVGMGAYQPVGSDRYPYTIYEVKGNRITVRPDKYRRFDPNGLSEDQVYITECWPEREAEVFTLRRSGRWIKRGFKDGRGSPRLVVGERQTYRDRSF